jgi:hypothetical protein
MKNLLIAVLALAVSFSVNAQEKKADDVAKFQSDVIDLGKIKQGTPTTAKFLVSNISGEPLIIEQANPTCGCTISDYTKEPIAAGKSGEINATYNAANPGAFEKRLTVKFAGVNEIKSITIKGQVLSADEYAKLNGESAPAAQAITEAPAAPAKPAAPAAKAAATPAKPKAATATAPKKKS